QAEDGIRDGHVTGVQTCALPILRKKLSPRPVHVAHPMAAGLPDPMAPLAISDLLPKQPAAVAPVVRTVAAPVTSRAVDIANIRPAPLIKTSIKRPAPSPASVTALVLACAAAALLIIAGAVWWAVSHGRTRD